MILEILGVAAMTAFVAKFAKAVESTCKEYEEKQMTNSASSQRKAA